MKQPPCHKLSTRFHGQPAFSSDLEGTGLTLFPMYINPENSDIQHQHLEDTVQAAAKHALLLYDLK